MSTLWHDILYALRVLWKKPGFTAIAAFSLALGIGANTVIFSLVNGVLLSSLPYDDPSRIVSLENVPDQRPQQRDGATPHDLAAWNEYLHSYEAIGGSVDNIRNLGAAEDGSAPERVWGQAFNPSTFRVLGVKPVLGRVIADDEDKTGAPAPVCLISHRLWERRFHSDPQVLGKIIKVDDQNVTIIGVMPPGFNLADDDADYWSPSAYSRPQLTTTSHYIFAVARLKPGVSIRQAQTEADAVSKQLAQAYPAWNKGWSLKVEPLQQALYGGLRQPLLLLQGVVGFVLLIACANVAGLLLARASSRRAEVSIRAAIGAGRGRIVQQLLTESVLLALLGGVAGIILGWAGLRLFVATAPAGFPRLEEVHLNPSVLLFTAGVAILTGFLFGLVPALQTSKTDLASSLKETGRSAAGGRRQVLRSVLVTVQIALALILLIGAGLMINSFLRLQNNNLGVDTHNLLVFEIRFAQTQMMKPVSTYRGVGLWEIFPVTANTFDRVYERVRALPGVTSAAGSNIRPLAGSFGMPFSSTASPRLRPIRMEAAAKARRISPSLRITLEPSKSPSSAAATSTPATQTQATR